nr:MAG TPA: hypothetical protein [Caudoviricetes sp.]
MYCPQLQAEAFPSLPAPVPPSPHHLTPRGKHHDCL